MKSNKCFLVLALCLLALCLSTTQAQIPESSDPETGPRSSNGGLFSFLLKPLRATIRQAKQLLGSGVDNVSDTVDQVRLQAYKVFLSLYNKTYSPDELPRRMALFFQRRKEIEESVRSFREGKLPFAMRENEYTDWYDEELKKLTGVSLPQPEELEAEEKLADEGQQPSIVGHGRNQIDNDDEDNFIVKAQIPASKDWRDSGCVSKPIDQLKCGACYAIATMSVVETMRCLNQVSAPILSPQQIVDCATSRAGYSNYGCDGGWPTRVLKYLQDVRVASRETCYPFVRRQNTCKLRSVQSTNGCTVNPSPTNLSRIQYKVLHSENDILYHVANTGPVVTVMQASDKFLYYGTGIFDDPACSRRRDDVDHAIVIVGYGRQNGIDYWIIKNSWGTTTWGQGGYGLYKRGRNACSIGHFGWVVTG